MTNAGVCRFLLYRCVKKMAIFTVASLLPLPMLLARDTYDVVTALKFFQNVKPIQEAESALRLLQQGVSKREEEIDEEFRQYDYDVLNGYMSFEDFESKVKAFEEERKILLEVLRYNQEKFDKFKKKFFESQDVFLDEYSLDYKLETLNKVLTIYQNPTLTVWDGLATSSSSLTGYTLWQSGLTLARYLEVSCANNSWIRGKTILELGSGTGYISIVAAGLGGNVTAVDLPQMIPFIRKNIDVNYKLIEEAGGTIRTQVLHWGDEEGAKSIPKPDVILTSGTVYYEQSVEPLVTTLVALSNEDTKLLLCNENWSKTPKHSIFWNAFYSLAKEHFKLSSVPIKALTLPRAALGYGSRNGVLCFRGKLK